MSAIALNSSWEEMLPRKAVPERLENWRAWLAIARAENPNGRDAWDAAETCHDCRHYQAADWWCKLQYLPAAFNPILTPKGSLGMACMGMACMGAGKNWAPGADEPETEQAVMDLWGNGGET